MGPCVSVIMLTQRAVAISVDEGPKDFLHAVTHVLCISKFQRLDDLGACYIIIFPKVFG